MEIFHVVLGGIAVIALTYVLVSQASNVHAVAASATKGYANVATTFQGGGPGSKI